MWNLRTAKAKRTGFLANKVPRPDIVDAFGATEALMCGLDLRISTRKLADGPVKIRVYVKHDGVFYTDNQSTKGEYHHRFGKRGRSMWHSLEEWFRRKEV